MSRWGISRAFFLGAWTLIGAAWLVALRSDADPRLWIIPAVCFAMAFKAILDWRLGPSSTGEFE